MKEDYIVKNGMQLALSSKDENLWSERHRKAKAKMILAVLREEFGEKALGKMVCLDYGCSTGIISNSIASGVKKIAGVDIDAKAIAFANKARAGNAKFVLYDGKRIPLPDSSVDLVLCHQVYEHVPSHNAMAKEILRVLKPSGFCYFSGGNRLMVMEGHYNLPFLSWLPRSLADLYVRLSGRGQQYYEKHLSLWGLRKLFAGFEIRDYTLRLLSEPEKFNATNPRIPIVVAKALYPLIPTFVWMMKKKPR